MERESIFRREALEHYRRGRGPGELIRLSPVWTTWAFWLLLVLFASLFATSLLVTLGEDVEAAAVIDPAGASVVALVPTTYSDDLEVGDEMSLEWPGRDSSLQLTIESIGDPIAPGSSEGLPDSVATLAAAQSQATFPVYGSLPSDPAPGPEAPSTTGTVVVHIEERLLWAVVPGLQSLFGSDG